MQLRLCDDPLGVAGLPYRSFLRIDAVHEVPLEVLEGELSWGRQLELKAQSYRNLLSFMRRKGVKK